MPHDQPTPEFIPADRQRWAAGMFDYANILVISLAGLPLLVAGHADGRTMILATTLGIIPIIFWFGMSMLLYAFNRHHPNPKVGHYTQRAAYRFYAVTGFLLVAGVFFHRMRVITRPSGRLRPAY